MKNTANRLFCLLLCAVMVMGMFPAAASAAQNGKRPVEYEETTVTTEHEGYMVNVGKDGTHTYIPTTFEKEHTVIAPAKEDAGTSFPVKKAITESEWGGTYFETFEDLKELASRSYADWTSVHYRGDGDLVISESLTLPNYLEVYITNGEDLVIPAGVTLTTGNSSGIYNHEGGLTVAGTLILNNYATFKGDVTVTGTIQTNSVIQLNYDSDLVGKENILFTNDWANIRYYYEAESLTELKEAVAVAKANPGNNYEIYLEPGEDIVLSSNLTFPENATFDSWNSQYKITVNAGISLTFNSDTWISNPMVIKGKLVNNGKIWYYGNNNDNVMQFTSTGSYSGNGFLFINVNDDDVSYTPYVTGLDTTDMDVVEYQDEWEHYWQIQDLSGLTRLSVPTSLSWNKAETWEYNESTGNYESKVVTSYGNVRFKAGSVLDESQSYTDFHVTLYKDGKHYFSTYYGYDNEYLKSGSYLYIPLTSHVDFESGEYYFTIQAVSESADYAASPIATSSKWTYTKPDSRYARPTSTAWKDGPNAVWTPTSDNWNAKVEFYFSPTQDGTPNQIYYTWVEAMTSCEIQEWALQNWGPGYYYFKVKTLSDNINRRANSAWTSMSKAYHYTGEERPVKPPMEVFFDNYNGCPRLEIKRSPGANDYEIYRATSKTGTYKKIDTIQIFGNGFWYKYFDTTATAGRTYYYKVRAVSYAGIKSYFCDVDSCKVRLAQPQVSISNDASTGKPVVKWETVEGAAKYYVYRATSKTGEFKKVYTGITARSYKDTETKAGKVYYYYVVAVHEKSDYNSSSSSTVYTRCDLKRPVVTISLTSGGNPYLKWSEISGAEKYFIYRATSKSGSYTRIGSTTTLKYVDKDVTAGKTYYYRVKAIHANSGANSAYSATDSIKAK